MNDAHLEEIRRQIIAGIDSARRKGVAYLYPDQFTVFTYDKGVRTEHTYFLMTTKKGAK